jgi:serine/threonine protein kinase
LDQAIAGAWRLEGTVLKSGWKVVCAIGWDPKTGQPKEIYNGTGGNFSKAYRVEKAGKQAFLKAIDLTRSLQEADVMSALHKVTSEHQFEVSILNLCAGAKMDRIVVALDSGQERLGPNLHDVVPYLVFELAEGDVRKQIKVIDPPLKRAWWLRALHHATVGLNQLHGSRITHQDLKPSNILSFGTGNGFKLGDLGRSTCENTPGPFDNLSFPGDQTYAPLEILYSNINPDVFQRRLSCDCYMLGSMIFFFGLGLGATRLFMDRTPPENRPYMYGGGWQGTYGHVLPLLQSVFTQILADLSASLPDDQISAQLVVAARDLCNPDPSLRGHPLTRGQGGNNYSLERYVSLFDKLAKHAAVNARTRN